LQVGGDATTSLKQGHKRGVALVDSNAELQITEILKASPERLAGSKIPVKLQLSHWQDKQFCAVYHKVTAILNADQGLSESCRKYGREGGEGIAGGSLLR